jgi:hypothetical protein
MKSAPFKNASVNAAVVDWGYYPDPSEKRRGVV